MTQYRTPIVPAPGDTIAALARTAPPVAAAGASAPWAQQPDETPDEYAVFMGWLGEPNSARAAVAPADRALAARHNWAERALAYDRTSTLAPVATGGSAAAQIVGNLARLVQIETRKLVEQAQTSPAPVVTLKDLTATVRVLQELHEAGRAATAAATQQDLSKLTTEELQAWIKINRKLQGNR